MPRTIHGPAEIPDPADHAGRGLIVNDYDSLEGMRVVASEAFFENLGGRSDAPGARDVFDTHSEPLRHLPPRNMREPAGLKHQDAVAGRERVSQGRFGRASPGGREDDHGSPGAEDPAQSIEHFPR